MTDAATVRPKKRALIVEDDAALARVLRDNLEYEGFEVECATTGLQAMALAKSSHPDVVLLDVTLPDSSGFDLLEGIRHDGRTAIIMLTARSQKSDKLEGLIRGADDYVTKPFDLEELLARIHAVLRRSPSTLGHLVLGAVTIDFDHQVTTGPAGPIHLTRREFDLLRHLAERRGRIVHRDELLREVWGYADKPLTRSVDHAVARLRKKVEPDPHRPQFIHTVHGDGYCLTIP
jgi:DNA-binding response OmpR family regulator